MERYKNCNVFYLFFIHLLIEYYTMYDQNDDKTFISHFSKYTYLTLCQISVLVHAQRVKMLENK